LTKAQLHTLEKVEDWVGKALDELPSVTGDTDQTSARNVLERAARLIDTHLPEIRARHTDIEPPTEPDPPAPAITTPEKEKD
jgi:hypothetical protein